MQAEQFLSLLRNPRGLTSEDVEDLRSLLRLYPYFQAVHVLLAKAAHDKDRSHAGQAVQKAAVYATDRNHLKALLEDSPPFATPIPKAKSVASASNQREARPGVWEYDHVNSYIDAIQQKKQLKITNQKSLAQLDSIQAFLQKNVDFRPSSPQKIRDTEVSQIDFTQGSAVLRDDLATENLARVLQQQGKLQQALAIYEKLVLKFPEKRAYFAPFIEQIKHQVQCLLF